jgi:hypothetical protein
MTEDFLSRAMREYEKVRPRETMKPSLEARLDWLEADASAQRMAIIKLERAFKSFAFHCCIALAVYAAALVVLFT